MNALHEACDYPPNWSEAIRLAAEEEELLREKDGDEYLPLHYACFNSLTLEVAKALVGPFPEGVLVKGKNGRTALDYAISQGVAPEVLAFLRSATEAAVRAQQPKPKPGIDPLTGIDHSFGWEDTGPYVPIPARYASPKTSGIECTIAPGEQAFDIELTK